MNLTDRKVKSTHYVDKPIKVYDGGGLFLHITRTAKTWRYSYRVGGKPRDFTIGKYPLISLKEARSRHRDAQMLVLDGIDPVGNRRSQKAESIAHSEQLLTNQITVEKVKDDWLKLKLEEWAPSTAKKNLYRLKNLPLSFLKKPIKDVKPADIMALLDEIQNRGAIDLAHRIKSDLLKNIFQFAASKEIIDSNPVLHPSVILKSRPRKQPYAHTTDPIVLGKIMAAIDSYVGDRAIESALSILPHVFARPGQLLSAKWEEISIDDAIWISPASSTKGNLDHMVPLSSQVLEVLSWQREYSGDGELVFPSQMTGRSLSPSSLNLALRSVHIDKETQCGHGFRHTASTMLNERKFLVDGEPTRFHTDAIEKQLSHIDSSVRGVYNRSEYIDERTTMMQAWSDYLEQLKNEHSKP